MTILNDRQMLLETVGRLCKLSNEFTYLRRFNDNVPRQELDRIENEYVENLIADIFKYVGRKTYNEYISKKGGAQ